MLSAQWFSDTSVYGWSVLAVDLVAAFLAFRAARSDISGTVFWHRIGWIMLALALNKQLDLQVMLTELIREAALAQHWYGERRVVQAGFIAVLAAGALFIVASIAVQVKRWSIARRMAFSGIVFVTLFALIRAASFHHIDFLATGTPTAIIVTRSLEWFGSALVALAAALAGRRGKPAQARST